MNISLCITTLTTPFSAEGQKQSKSLLKLVSRTKTIPNILTALLSQFSRHQTIYHRICNVNDDASGHRSEHTHYLNNIINIVTRVWGA